MLVFNDSIISDAKSDISNRFWIKNTISNVKLKKSNSKTDTNLVKKIIIKQQDYESNFLKLKNCKKQSKKTSKKTRKNLNNNQYINKRIFHYNGKKQTKKIKKAR